MSDTAKKLNKYQYKQCVAIYNILHILKVGLFIGVINVHFCYNDDMEKNSLLHTNPYLKDPALRRRLIERSVVTSCGVEGIKISFTEEPSPTKKSNQSSSRN